MKRVDSSKADAVGDVFSMFLESNVLRKDWAKAVIRILMSSQDLCCVENVSSQSLGPGLDVRIDNGPSPPENCKQLRIFVINTKYDVQIFKS